MKQISCISGRRSARHSVITLWGVWGVLTLTWGCQPMSRSHSRAVASLLATSPIGATQCTTLHCLPSTYEPSRVMDEIEVTGAAVLQWLAPNNERPHVHVAILAPEEPRAEYWQTHVKASHGHTGRFYHQANLLLVIGDPNQSRFWQVLRHEAAHAVLEGLVGAHDTVFWFNEGVASLFEMGVDQALDPSLNRERRAQCTALIDGDRMPGLRTLVTRRSMPTASGKSYARAWACAAYLYHQKKDLGPYIQALQRGLPNRVAFEECVLGPEQSLAEFERKVLAWLEAL